MYPAIVTSQITDRPYFIRKTSPGKQIRLREVSYAFETGRGWAQASITYRKHRRYVGGYFSVSVHNPRRHPISERYATVTTYRNVSVASVVRVLRVAGRGDVTK